MILDPHTYTPIQELYARFVPRTIRGTWKIKDRLRAIVRLSAVAERTSNTRRHYTVCVPAWRCIELHRDAIRAHIARSAEQWRARFYLPPDDGIRYRVCLAGMALTERNAAERLNLWVTHYARQLQVPPRIATWAERRATYAVKDACRTTLGNSEIGAHDAARLISSASS